MVPRLLSAGSIVLSYGILPDQGSNPCLLHWQADSFTTEPPGKPLYRVLMLENLGSLLSFSALLMSGNFYHLSVSKLICKSGENAVLLNVNIHLSEL